MHLCEPLNKYQQVHKREYFCHKIEKNVRKRTGGTECSSIVKQAKQVGLCYYGEVHSDTLYAGLVHRRHGIQDQC